MYHLTTWTLSHILKMFYCKHGTAPTRDAKFAHNFLLVGLGIEASKWYLIHAKLKAKVTIMAVSESMENHLLYSKCPETLYV